MKTETSFWIQEQAPAHNYVNSIGLDKSTSLIGATNAFRGQKEWLAKHRPNVKSRLVLRVDTTIAE